MSTITVRTASFAELGPLLVSELPPAAAVSPSLWSRLRARLTARREARAFERAIRCASPNEHGDLLAARRRR